MKSRMSKHVETINTEKVYDQDEELDGEEKNEVRTMGLFYYLLAR